jgi:F-type H+-transporting ATPase subunit alpha
VDVGLSVSRVGGSAQFKAIRKISGRLRLDLAQYREMAAFAQFGSDLDKATQDKLAQGARLMEVLKQPQFAPYTVAQQFAILYTAVNGFLMDIEPKKVPAFVKGFLEYLAAHNGTTLETLNASGASSPEIEEELTAAVENFKQVHK